MPVVAGVVVVVDPGGVVVVVPLPLPSVVVPPPSAPHDGGGGVPRKIWSSAPLTVWSQTAPAPSVNTATNWNFG